MQKRQLLAMSVALVTSRELMANRTQSTKYNQLRRKLNTSNNSMLMNSPSIVPIPQMTIVDALVARSSTKTSSTKTTPTTAVKATQRSTAERPTKSGVDADGAVSPKTPASTPRQSRPQKRARPSSREVTERRRRRRQQRRTERRLVCGDDASGSRYVRWCL